MALNHHNWDYEPEPGSPTGNDVPIASDDRYTPQDIGRDYWAPIDQMSRAISSMTNGQNVRLSGGDVIQGSTPTVVTVPAQSGIVRYQVTTPGPRSTGGFPPAALPTTIFIPVESTEQLDTAMPGAVLDGSTVNYVKIAYAETDGDIRARDNGPGSYAYEKIPSFILSIDTTAPTDFELLIATFTGDGVGALTITQAPRWNVADRVTFAGGIDVAGTVTAATVDTGQGPNNLFPMDQGVSTGADVTFATVTAATVNTGQGANELYAMNQNVRSTDNVTFATVYPTTLGTRATVDFSIGPSGGTFTVPAGIYYVGIRPGAGGSSVMYQVNRGGGLFATFLEGSGTDIVGGLIISDGGNIRILNNTGSIASGSHTRIF